MTLESREVGRWSAKERLVRLAMFYGKMSGALPELGRGALRTPWLDRELEERVNEAA